eukprot:TRINITY_DN7653_c0_g2_i7.p1 TRINITY_DN7653_c0_g2~~TRINITY_DN7653_c0_g2_i7.p1  ORF type:complete len:335 (+),score=41.99 TRINITY_DN7653_c0_g2_i7:108-1112(+)
MCIRDRLIRAFMELVDGFIQSQSDHLIAKDGKIKLYDFLYLAVKDYHDSRNKNSEIFSSMSMSSFHRQDSERQIVNSDDGDVNRYFYETPTLNPSSNEDDYEFKIAHSPFSSTLKGNKSDSFAASNKVAVVEENESIEASFRRFLEKQNHKIQAPGDRNTASDTKMKSGNVEDDRLNDHELSILKNMEGNVDEFVDLVMPEKTMKNKNQQDLEEVKAEVKRIVNKKCQKLLLALFKGDKMRWLDQLLVQQPNPEQLAHVESLQMDLRKLMKTTLSQLGATEVSNFNKKILKTTELSREIGRLILQLSLPDESSNDSDDLQLQTSSLVLYSVNLS